MKLILTDCDGVVLNWLDSFYSWARHRGYDIKNDSSYDISNILGVSSEKAIELANYFSNSADIVAMGPHLDAIKYIRKLHEDHGYVFHAITSLSNNPHAQALRTQNLKMLFGTAFQEFHYLKCGADKSDVLSRYKDTGLYWIEDNMQNAHVGFIYGLKPIVMAQNYNVDTPYTRVQDWKELYEVITNG